MEKQGEFFFKGKYNKRKKNLLAFRKFKKWKNRLKKARNLLNLKETKK
jgi:hypothetical protein